jgi:uncharacterized membrane protein
MNARPAGGGVFERPETRPYVRYHAANALLLIGLWAFTMYLYPHLPDRIPGHVGVSGVTRWDPRESGIWFLIPLLGTMNALVLYALAGAAGGVDGISTPHRKRLKALPREAQRYALQPMRGFMYGMVSWVLLLMLFIQLMNYRIALAGSVGAFHGRTLIIGIVLFTAIPLIMVVVLSRTIRRRIDEASRGEA